MPQVRRFVQEIGEAAGLSEDRITDAKVAVSEACANAIEHAHSGVDVTAQVLTDRVVVEVRDSGPFRMRLRERGEPRLRGFGLALMVSLADQVHVSRLTDGRTRVTLAFYLSEDRRMEDSPDLRPLDAAAGEPENTTSREHYRIVADSTCDWEHWHTPDGRFVYVSPAVERITGYPPEAFLDDPDLLFRLVHADDRTGVKAHFQSGRECPEGFEFRIIRPDGEVRTVEHVCQMVRDGEGRILGRRGSNRDVTNRKQTEAAAWESHQRERITQTRRAEQQRMYEILERLPATVCLQTDDRRVLFANRSFRRYYDDLEPGYEEDKPDGVDRWQRALPDGRYLDLHRFPFRDADGSPLLLEVGIDVTEPRHLEEELRSASDYSRSLIEASLDPLVTIDADGTIRDVNKATEDVTGCLRSELIGTDFSSYFTDPAKARAGYEQVFRDGAVRDFPLEISSKDGRLTPVLYNASLYRDREGQVAGVFAAARDVSGLRQAEKALELERRRLSDVLQMLPVYAILLSPDHHVPFANRFFEERFGASGGKRCFEYLFGRRDPCESCQSFEPLDTGASHRWEWTGPDGRTYDIVDFPFTDVDGSRLIMEVGVDVTERKRAEAELQEARDRLEIRVNERTAELIETTRRLQTEVEERQRREAEKERQLQEQRAVAERLQTALLTVPTSIGDVKIGHIYRSATEYALVGGDFYDVFQVKGGRVGILIGDVAGHGVEAARAATFVRDVIRAFAHLSTRPQEILLHTNGLLLERSTVGFVTAFFGILDPDNGALRYCSAGHPEAFLRHTSGEVEALRSGSIPLGVLPDAAWRPDTARLARDDVLFLYTDGLIEARHDGDFFGEERLMHLLKGRRVSVQKLPRLIFDQVMAFSEGSLRDDAAILALSLTGKRHAVDQPANIRPEQR